MTTRRLPDRAWLLLLTLAAVAVAALLDEVTRFNTADWLLFLTAPAPLVFVARYARVRWTETVAGRALMLKSTGTLAFLVLAVLGVTIGSDWRWWDWARFLVYGYLFAAQWYLTLLLLRLQSKPGHHARTDTLTEGSDMTPATKANTTSQGEPLAPVAAAAAVVSAVIAALVAFGVDLTTDQVAAIMGLVAAVGPVVVWLIGRRGTVPTGNVVAFRAKSGEVVAGDGSPAETGTPVLVRDAFGDAA